jgi:hypothetical protein
VHCGNGYLIKAIAMMTPDTRGCGDIMLSPEIKDRYIVRAARGISSSSRAAIGIL